MDGDPYTERMRRGLLAIVGTVYLCWWFLVEALLPEANNPLGSRLVTVSLCYGAYLASYGSPLARRHLQALCGIAFSSITLHYYYLVLLNHGTTPWAMGAYVVVVATSVCFATRAGLLRYSVFTLALALLVSAAEPTLMKSIFFPGLLTMLFLCNVSLHHRVRLEQERERTALVEEELARRDEFIRVSSHELRTPLTALLLNIEVLQSRLQVEADIRSATRCRDQVKRLGRLIDTLIDTSRLVADELELIRERVSLLPLVRNVVDELQPEAPAQTPIEVVGDESAGGDWDRNRIEQMLTSLLRNAILFGAGHPVDVRVENQADRVVLTVRDHGIGVAAEQHERIFQRFHRAVPAQNYGGMGLGLFTVQQIVAAHKGSVRVESETGQGATFVVELPRAEVN